MQKQGSIQQSCFQAFSACYQPNNHYLSYRKLLQPLEVSQKHLPYSCCALKHFEWNRQTLGTEDATCSTKTSSSLTVWKCSGAFWENSLCKTWWEPLRWHGKACRPVSLSWCNLNQHLASENVRCCTGTHSQANANLLLHFIHSAHQLHTQHQACGILTINSSWFIPAIKSTALC